MIASPRAEARKSDGPAQAGKQEVQRVNSSFLHLWVLFKPSKDWRMPVTLGAAICFTESTESRANLIGK